MNANWKAEIAFRNISVEQIMALRSKLGYIHAQWSTPYVLKQAFESLGQNKGSDLSVREVLNLDPASHLGKKPILVHPDLQKPLLPGQGILIRNQFYTCIEPAPLSEAASKRAQTLEQIGEMLEKGTLSIEDPIPFYANLAASGEKIERGVLELEKRRVYQIIGKRFREAETGSDRCGNWLLTLEKELSLEERFARYAKLGMPTPLIKQLREEIKGFKNQFTAGYIQTTTRDLLNSLREQSLKWHLQIEGLEPKTKLLLLKNTLEGMSLLEQKAFFASFQCPASLKEALSLKENRELFAPEVVEILIKSPLQEESPKTKTSYNVSLGEAHTRFIEKLRETKEQIEGKLGTRLTFFSEGRFVSLNPLLLGQGKAPLLFAVAYEEETPAKASLASFFQEGRFTELALTSIAAGFAKNERLIDATQAEKTRAKTSADLATELHFQGETSSSFAKISALQELYRSIQSKYNQAQALTALLSNKRELHELLYFKDLLKLQEAYGSILSLFTQNWDQHTSCLFRLNTAIASQNQDAMSQLGIDPAHLHAKQEWEESRDMSVMLLADYQNNRITLEDIEQSLTGEKKLASTLEQVNAQAFLAANGERRAAILELLPSDMREAIEAEKGTLDAIAELKNQPNGTLLAQSREKQFAAIYQPLFEINRAKIYYNYEKKELEELVLLQKKEEQYQLYHLLSAPQVTGKEASLGNALCESLIEGKFTLLKSLETLRIHGSDLKIRLESEQKMESYEREMTQLLKESGCASGDFRNYNPFIRAYQTVAGRLVQPLQKVIENCIPSTAQENKKHATISLLSEIYVEQGRANSSSRRLKVTIHEEPKEKRPSFLKQARRFVSYFFKQVLWTKSS